MIAWLKSLLSSSDTASIKRLCFFMAVVSSMGWLTADLVIHKGITDPWNSAFYAFLSAAAGGYIGGLAFGEKKKDVSKDEELQ